MLTDTPVHNAPGWRLMLFIASKCLTPGNVRSGINTGGGNRRGREAATTYSSGPPHQAAASEATRMPLRSLPWAATMEYASETTLAEPQLPNQREMYVGIMDICHRRITRRRHLSILAVPSSQRPSTSFSDQRRHRRLIVICRRQPFLLFGFALCSGAHGIRCRASSSAYSNTAPE